MRNFLGRYTHRGVKHDVNWDVVKKDLAVAWLTLVFVCCVIAAITFLVSLTNWKVVGLFFLGTTCFIITLLAIDELTV